MSDNKLPQFTEYEHKYKVQFKDLNKFLTIMQDLSFEQTGKLNLSVQEGPDEYWELNDKFIRYRHKIDGSFSELTTKVKKKNSKSNVDRTEVNLNITGNSPFAVREMLKLLGFTHNFTITKKCYIFEFPMVIVSFYFVHEGDGGEYCVKNIEDLPKDSFVEIEIKEDIVHTISKGTAERLIGRYLNSLIFINPRNKLTKSLWEMYRKGW